MSDYNLQQITMKLQVTDIWFLTDAQLLQMDQSIDSFQQAKLIVTATSFFANYITGGSMAVCQIIIIMQMIDIVKYIPLNWPPNVIKQFTIQGVKIQYLFPYTFKDSVFQLQRLPAKYAAYQISSLFLNNTGELFMQFLFYITLGFLLTLLSRKFQLIKNIIIRYLVMYTYQLVAFNYIIFFYLQNFVSAFVNVMIVIKYVLLYPNPNADLQINNIIALVFFILQFFFIFHMIYIARTCQKEIQIQRLIDQKNQQDQEILKLQNRIRVQTQFRWDNLTQKEQQEVKNKDDFFQLKQIEELQLIFGESRITKEKIEKFKEQMQSYYQIQAIDKFYQVKDEDRLRFLSNYRILWYDYKKDKLMYSFYFIFDILRLILIGIILVFMYDSPLIQCIILIIIIMSYALILLKFFPYQDKVATLFVVITELLVVMMSSCISLLGYNDYILIFDNTDQRFQLGYTILYCIQLVLYMGCVSNIYVIYTQALVIYAQYQESQRKEYLKNKDEAEKILRERENEVINYQQEKLILIKRFKDGEIQKEEFLQQCTKKELQITKKQAKGLIRFIDEKKGIYNPDTEEENEESNQSEEFKDGNKSVSELTITINNTRKNFHKHIKPQQQQQKEADHSVISIDMNNEYQQIKPDGINDMSASLNSKNNYESENLLSGLDSQNINSQGPIHVKKKKKKEDEYKQEQKKQEKIEEIQQEKVKKKPMNEIEKAQEKERKQLEKIKREKEEAIRKAKEAKKEQARLKKLALMNKKKCPDYSKVIQDFKEQLIKLQQKPGVSVAEINELKRKILVYENREQLKLLDEMSDDEFVQNCNNPAFTKSVIQNGIAFKLIPPQ